MATPYGSFNRSAAGAFIRSSGLARGDSSIGTVIVGTDVSTLATSTGTNGRISKHQSSWAYKTSAGAIFLRVNNLARCNANTIIAGLNSEERGGAAGLLRSTDDGNTWTASSLGKNNLYVASYGSAAIAMEYKDQSTGGVRVDMSMYRSTDYGATWSLVVPTAPFNAPFGNLPGAIANPIRCVALAMLPSVAFMCALTADSTNRARLYRSTDNGATWARLAASYTSDCPSCWCDLGGGVVLMGTGLRDVTLTSIGVVTPGAQSSIYRSTDTGATWTKVANTLANVINVGFSDIVDMGGGVALALLTNGKLYRTTDYGLTWALFYTFAFGAALTPAWSMVRQADGTLVANGRSVILLTSVNRMYLSEDGTYWRDIESPGGFVASDMIV